VKVAGFRTICVAAAAGAILAGCEKSPESKSPAVPAPSHAARVELPRASTPATPNPIITTEVCSGAVSHGNAAPFGGRSFGQLLWQTISPRQAFAQRREEVSTAKANGDVHLQTLNGLRYDFQGVGEFIALKVQSGGFEIQVRHQPYGTSKVVSVTTAIAMDVAGDHVAIYVGQEVPLRLNHQPRPLSEPTISLPHGGQVQQQGNGLVVIWPDKSQVRVQYGSYLDYIVTLCPGPQTEMAGLLGSPGAPAEKSLTARNNVVVPISGLTRDDFNDRLYHIFGDGWRISQSESLFDYDNAQTTETFTDRKFPYAPDPLEKIDDAQRQAAEATCRKAGITDANALADCVMDVAVSGDAAFADNNALLETMFIKTRLAQAGVGSWRCRGPQGAPGWACTVGGLTGARIGTSMTLSVETLQSGQKALEALTCGPITDAYDANCPDKTRGTNFQDAQVVERYTLQSGEQWEIRSRGVCDVARAPGEPC
jgi:VWD domain-containing protein